MLFVEGGDRRRRAGQNTLELLGRGTASRFAHRFLVRFRSSFVFFESAAGITAADPFISAD
jgi:hypothetical protein